MRKAFAAIAAVPAIAGIYLQVVRRRRPRAVRVVAATLVLALAGLVAELEHLDAKAVGRSRAKAALNHLKEKQEQA